MIIEDSWDAVIDHSERVTVDQHTCGPLDVECEFCHSLNFIAEKPQDRVFTKCCQKGKVILPDLKPYPDELFALITGTSSPVQK